MADAFRDQEGHGALCPALCKIGVVLIGSDLVGMADDAEARGRVIHDPFGLSAETRLCGGVQRVLVEAEIDDIRHFGAHLFGQRHRQARCIGVCHYAASDVAIGGYASGEKR